MTRHRRSSPTICPRFQAAGPPDPSADDWERWIELLGSRETPDGDPKSAMNVEGAGVFGTVCSHLLALPAIGEPVMRFASRADRTKRHSSRSISPSLATGGPPGQLTPSADHANLTMD